MPTTTRRASVVFRAAIACAAGRDPRCGMRLTGVDVGKRLARTVHQLPEEPPRLKKARPAQEPGEEEIVHAALAAQAREAGRVLGVDGSLRRAALDDLRY